MALSKNDEKKIMKKVKRCQHMISKESGVECSDSSTKFILICNAGLSSGLQQEALLEEILKYGQVSEIVMPPGKSYCFLRFETVEQAALVYEEMNGKSKLGQNGTVIYLTYCQTIPEFEDPWSKELPSGLTLIEDFVDDRTETVLLNCIDLSDSEESSLKHRKVKHYGYEFIYGSNNVDVNSPLDQKIPFECDDLWDKLKEMHPELQWHVPEQMTVNRYKAGQGIPPHVDTHSAFLDPIISLSLGSDVVMEFKDTKGNHVHVDLPRKSLLIMTGESRYGWTHGITPRSMDIVRSKAGGLTIRKRSLRVSFTFRKLQNTPCNCEFNLLCDTYLEKRKKDEENKILDASKLEVENVHKVYNEIAKHFSETRHSPWPNVEEFLNSLKIGGVLIDIGCGNGKYLNTNPNILKIGCDRSEGLLKVCHERNLNVFQCDCLAVPLNDCTVDACISIAVIHHLASYERRLKAVNEMARILVKGGKGLIYVWAKNQEADAKKSSYLRQNKQNNKKEKRNQEISIEKEEENKGALPIHTNRTQFQHQDVLVPWKLKHENRDEKQTFLRYYHVFEENELQKLCEQLETIKVIKNYYDQGNWCVIFEKI